jgi:2-methylfumaryl-CoA isomerase
VPSNHGHGRHVRARIIELSAFVAAPLAGMTLAGLGYDVVRIDPPGGGLDFHRWPLTAEGESIFWTGLNRGKRSVVVDFRRPEGRELVAAMIIAGQASTGGGQPRGRQAPGSQAPDVQAPGSQPPYAQGPDIQPGPDRPARAVDAGHKPVAGASPAGVEGGVFLTNLGPGGPLRHQSLCRRRPDVITVEIQGYPDGRSAVDYTVAASTGIPLLTGPEAHIGPVNSPLPTWDIATGLTAAMAVQEAVWDRRVTGNGTRARLALADVALSLLAALGFVDEERLAEMPRRRDGNYLYGAFGRDFRLADGARVMVVAITAKQWRSLVDALDMGSEIERLERESGLDLSQEGDRWHARRHIATVVERWCSTRHLAEVAATFDAYEVCWGQYGAASNFARSYGLIGRAGGGGKGEPELPIRFGDGAANAPGRTPALGEHTFEVLTTVLGLSQHEIGRLHDDGLVAGMGLQGRAP